MNMKLFLVSIVCFGALSGCASGESAGQPASAIAQNSGAAGLAADEKDDKICKVRAITGSRFKQKTCMTAKEWENMAQETKKMLDKNTRNKVRTDPSG